MYPALILLAEATGTPNPEPTLREGLDPAKVTPGAVGFFVTAAVVIIAILLMFDMVRRVRRIRYREMAEQKLLAEQREKFDGASNPEGGSVVSGEVSGESSGPPSVPQNAKHDGDASPDQNGSPESGSPKRP